MSRKIFNFRSALVVPEEDGTGFRVRFWARETDQLRLLPSEETYNYKPDAHIVLDVYGEEGGEPTFPALDEGEQLFPGPSVEVVFRGGCWADVDEYGLHVHVPEARISCIDTTGLPCVSEQLEKSDVIDFLGEVMSGRDTPPHWPPPK